MRAPFEPVRFLVPLAVLGAVAAFATHELSPGAAAEGLFLGELSAAVLLVVAALAPAPAFELGLGSVLAVTAVWGLPPGPGRGAAVMLLLTATFAASCLRRLSRTLPDLPLSVSIPLALGFQLLLRSELLFEPPGFRTLVALIALPVAGGSAMAVLARRHGGDLALVAAGIAVLLGPGWNVTTTLGMIGAAAVSFVLRQSRLRLSFLLLPLGVLLALTALLDAYPWRREEPLTAALRVLAATPRMLVTPGIPILPPETSVTLDAAHPSRET